MSWIRRWMARQDYRAAAWISSSEAVLAAFLEIECVVVQFAYALEVIGVHLDGIGCSTLDTTLTT